MTNLPQISPYIFSINGIGPTWYGLMYIIAFVLGYYWAKKNKSWNKNIVESLFNHVILGVILGGRVGYVLFYQFTTFIDDPLFLFKIYEGGMSFHGGLIGVVLAIWLFSRKNKITFFSVMDYMAPIFPLGLFFGRIGNFINGELWGNATNLPWAIIFPNDPLQLPRHPSQLYEAILEGFVLFVIMYLFSKRKSYTGQASGLFLMLYGIFRFSIEFVRMPDSHIGYMAFDWLTRGQLLTIPMILLGAYLLFRGNKNAKLS